MKTETKVKISETLNKPINGSVLLTFLVLLIYKAWDYYWPTLVHPFFALVLDIIVVAICVFINVKNPSLILVGLELLKILGNGSSKEDKIEQCKIILKAVVHKYNRLWNEDPEAMQEAVANVSKLEEKPEE